MAKLLQVIVQEHDWDSLRRDEIEEQDFSDWCHQTLEQGLFIHNSGEEIFIMEQDYDNAIPPYIKEVAEVEVFKNDGPTQNYGT